MPEASCSFRSATIATTSKYSHQSAAAIVKAEQRRCDHAELDFNADEIERLRDLRDRERIGEHILPRPPILLTRRDLETTWFAATQERFHGHGRGELARFAAASASVYLQ